METPQFMFTIRCLKCAQRRLMSCFFDYSQTCKPYPPCIPCYKPCNPCDKQSISCTRTCFPCINICTPCKIVSTEKKVKLTDFTNSAPAVPEKTKKKIKEGNKLKGASNKNNKTDKSKSGNEETGNFDGKEDKQKKDIKDDADRRDKKQTTGADKETGKLNDEFGQSAVNNKTNSLKENESPTEGINCTPRIICKCPKGNKQSAYKLPSPNFKYCTASKGNEYARNISENMYSYTTFQNYTHRKPIHNFQKYDFIKDSDKNNTDSTFEGYLKKFSVKSNTYNEPHLFNRAIHEKCNTCGKKKNLVAQNLCGSNNTETKIGAFLSHKEQNIPPNNNFTECGKNLNLKDNGNTFCNYTPLQKFQNQHKTCQICNFQTQITNRTGDSHRKPEMYYPSGSKPFQESNPLNRKHCSVCSKCKEKQDIISFKIKNQKLCYHLSDFQ